MEEEIVLQEILKASTDLQFVASEIINSVKSANFLIPKSSPNRFRVEVVGEMAESWVDSGRVFYSPQEAENYVKDYVPANKSWRIMFETMQVTKFGEYKPPYIK